MREPTPGPISIADFEWLLAASDQKLDLSGSDVVAVAGGSVAHGTRCSRLPRILAISRMGEVLEFRAADVPLAAAELSAGGNAVLAP
jgi:hypothetical protein